MRAVEYGNPLYWDERYSRDPEPFDWYQKYTNLKYYIKKYVKPQDMILNVGAGNSRLSEEMYREGFKNIINIDISKVVIKTMQDKYRSYDKSFKYFHMNVKNMSFEDSLFDCVIDKGTFDALICAENPYRNLTEMLLEIHRVLKPGGFYLMLSNSESEEKLLILKQLNWSINKHIIQKTVSLRPELISAEEPSSQITHHILYCMQKSETPEVVLSKIKFKEDEESPEDSEELQDRSES